MDILRLCEIAVEAPTEKVRDANLVVEVWAWRTSAGTRMHGVL